MFLVSFIVQTINLIYIQGNWFLISNLYIYHPQYPHHPCFLCLLWTHLLMQQADYHWSLCITWHRQVQKPTNYKIYLEERSYWSCSLKHGTNWGDWQRHSDVWGACSWECSDQFLGWAGWILFWPWHFSIQIIFYKLWLLQ